MENLVEELLRRLGEDPGRPGLLDTPARVAASLQFLTKGYHEKVEDLVNGAIFDAANDEMVVVKDIEMYSMCEHHLLPFFGRVHVAYLPGAKIIGLSKIPRIVDIFARRLQIQERLTDDIARCLMQVLSPLGVMVVVEARHLCTMMRGVEKQNSAMVTSACVGAFRKSGTREEFLALIRR